MEHLEVKGAIVMVESEHLCMAMRGVKKVGSKTVTLVKKGSFKDDKDLTNAFLQMVR
jgi:GTP cyclohydrolase I